MINNPVLVLNQGYEPLNICRARRAIVLILQGKAEMLENGMGFIRSASDTIPIPTVIKLGYYVRRAYRERKFTRLGVFHRDNHTCQYCGKQSQQLTIDHVIPRSLNGHHTWGNVVSACIPCNHRKAGRTPKQAGMKLISQPVQPKDRHAFYIPHHYHNRSNLWQKYLSPHHQHIG
jgi:5-methylcytosine-specific restriction endonuclease McrA